jgi:glutamine synthetase
MIMQYTSQDVQSFVAEEDVRFIHLAFCDVFGRQKNIAILPSELPRAFSYGIAIDASAIRGFGGQVHSDLFLHPLPQTLTLLPWRPEQGKLVQMQCKVSCPDGSPFEADSREVLRRAVRSAEEKGYAFSIGSEMEFYLFQLDENGDPTKIPYDRAGYMDIAPEDKGENVRREICLTLEQMGMKPECSHHESGPGQNEIDFRYADPLTAADNAILFRTVVRTIAAQHGLWADFSPRPLPEHDGSGMHLNISLKNRDGESLLPQIIAGILDKIREMTVFLNPVENSYQRLGRDKAPGRISWSAENRSQLIRIPAAQGEYRRAELRSPDSMANPYLAIALVLYAVIDGAEEGLSLPEPVDSLEPEGREGIEKLPGTLEEAKALAAKSAFLKKHIPDMILNAYCRR